MIEIPWLHALKLPIFFAGYLYFPAVIFLAWAMATRSPRTRIIAGLLLAPLTILAYARFIEPRILLASEYDIELDRCFPEGGGVRIALLSDTHIGLFANAMPASRIAVRIKAAKPDAVLIAGDIAYFLPPPQMREAFQPFSEIGAPVYAVLGNHDLGIPGPDLRAPLTEALTSLGVAVIDNRRVEIPARDGVIELAGLSDLWERRQDMRVLDRDSDAPQIVLTHNPETVFVLPGDAQVDLLVAGHTHGGQIRIPGLTCALVPMACDVTRYGETSVRGRRVFVTSGTGMTGLPMRFLVPPKIDILDVRFRSCDEPE